MSSSPTPETTESQLFKRLLHSRIYNKYLESKVGPEAAAAAGKHGSLLDAWFGLCDEFMATNQLEDEAMPVLWDGQTKAVEVFAVSQTLDKLDEGYVLIGFATIGVDKKVLRAMPLPIFDAYETPIVTEAIMRAEV